MCYRGNLRPSLYLRHPIYSMGHSRSHAESLHEQSVSLRTLVGAGDTAWENLRLSPKQPGANSSFFLIKGRGAGDAISHSAVQPCGLVAGTPLVPRVETGQSLEKRAGACSRKPAVPLPGSDAKLLLMHKETAGILTAAVCVTSC